MESQNTNSELQSKVQQLLEIYPVITSMPVQWGDMDAFKHVNNTVYIRWCETGRVAYLEEFAGAYMKPYDSGLGTVLGAISCKYIFPVTYPDTIYIGTKVEEILPDRLKVQTLMASEKHERPVAFCEATVVAYNFKESKKGVFPDNFAELIQQFESDKRNKR